MAVDYQEINREFCNPDDLPESLKAISEQIGFEGTFRLIKFWGGRKLYIPTFIKPSHKISDKLGLETAQKLSKQFGGQTLSISTAIDMFKRARNNRIKKDRDTMSVSALAKKYNLTERQIWNILSDS